MNSQILNPFGWLLNPQLLLLPFRLSIAPLVLAGAMMGGGSLLGGLLGRQKAPQMAPFREVDVQAEARKAIDGNLANSDDIEQLVSRANRYTQNEANSMMEMAVPGFSALAKRFMELASSNLDDPYSLPEDVTQNIARLAAERGVSTGGRGQFGDFSMLRDFGISSLDYGDRRIGQSQQMLSLIAQLAPRVNPMSPLSFYITPAQQVDATVRNNAQQAGAQQAGYNAAAAASNANASMWGNIVSNLGGIAGAAVMMNGKPKAPELLF